MKVCIVSNELLLVYSFKSPVNNNFAKNQYSSTYNGPRKKFQQNLMQNGSQERYFQQKFKNHHTEYENCEKPGHSGEQSSIKSEVPDHEEPLNNEQVNGHSEHGSDDTNDKGGTKRETAISKANVEHPGNEDDLKNSDNTDPVSQKSHTGNGEQL
jgi:hypothetical protein